MAGSQSIQNPDVPTSVYRYYDSAAVLLYVGITGRGAARNAEHNKSKEWWPYITRQEVDHYRSRTTALNVERELIRQHRPPFNVQHNLDHEAIREAYLAFRERNVPMSPQTLIARATDSPLRFSLDVISTGSGVATLTSRPSDVLKVATIDLDATEHYDLGSCGRGARVLALDIEQGVLRVIVRVKGAEDVGGADVLLRQANRKGGRRSIKRVDLYLPPRLRPSRRRKRRRPTDEEAAKVKTTIRKATAPEEA